MLPCACIFDIRIYFHYFLVYLSKLYNNQYTVVVSNLLQHKNVYWYGATGWPQSSDQRPDSLVLLGCRGWYKWHRHGTSIVPCWAGHQRVSVSGPTTRLVVKVRTRALNGWGPQYLLKSVASRDLCCERISCIMSNGLFAFIIEDAGECKLTCNAVTTNVTK